jgi:hypothetical protein
MKLFSVAPVLVMALAIGQPGQALSQQTFSFEREVSLQDMQDLVRRQFPVGTPRDKVRAAFVSQGGGTLKIHPSQAGVEKYIYDINLCQYYVWRWNISADYDAGGALKQIYINGEAVLPDGAPVRTIPKAPPGQKAAVFKITRPRPEATKGEKSLAALVWDHDANLQTIDDQELIGAGPTRSDPANLGTLHMYRVEPWRSIFDMDEAKSIVAYAGSCAAADAKAAQVNTAPK